MSSTVLPQPNSVKEFIEQFKAFEKSFTRRMDAALFFAGKGIGAFPLHTVKNGVCTCRKADNCKTPGKHPMHKNWQNEATIDLEKIRRMWLANPDANIGLAMGNGLVGVDIDIKNGKDGWKEWQRILKNHDSEQIVSLIQTTPSGGLHIVLKVRDSSLITGSADALAIGVDTRSDGQFLVGGSSENDKGTYGVFDIPIQNAPGWLESLMIGKGNWVKPMIKRILTGVIFNEGERNNACLAYLSFLNRQRVTREGFEKKMRDFAKNRCKPSYDDPALDYMIEHYYNPAGITDADVPTFVDLGKPSFKIWEIPEYMVREALTALYEHVPQGPEEAYELAKRNLPNLLMQYLKQTFHVSREISFGNPQDTLFWYNGKFYESEPTSWYLREKLEYLTSNHISGSEKSEVLTKLMDNAYRKEQQERYIALENVLLDCEKFGVIEFTPDKFATVHLPVVYDKDEKHPILDEFLGEVVNEDEISHLQEWAGYLLIPEYPVKKGLIVIGPTDSGKSTFLSAQKEILGITNVSSATLQQLSKADGRFVTSKLYKKLANIAPDMPTNSVGDTSIFKGITGRDLIPGEFKYKNPFDFQPRSKLMFSANSLPSVKEDDEAFFNRWDIIVFHKPPEIDTTLLDKLKTELSGILNWMIDGARRITDNGMKFTNSTPTVGAMQIWEIASNPVKAFYNKCTVKEGEEEIPCTDFYVAYEKFSRIFHAKLVDEDIFDQQFSKISKTQIITRQRNYEKMRFRKGLKIRPENEWIESNVYGSDESNNHQIDTNGLYEKVKKTFMGLSSPSSDYSNIEKWISSEYNISLNSAHSIIEGWIANGLVAQNGRALEFPKGGV